jgi:hypothetical protein
MDCYGIRGKIMTYLVKKIDNVVPFFLKDSKKKEIMFRHNGTWYLWYCNYKHIGYVHTSNNRPRLADIAV